MDDIVNLENLHTNEVPEKYKPFNCAELSDRQIEFARKFLNETEETRSKYLRRVRRFLDSKHSYSFLFFSSLTKSK